MDHLHPYLPGTLTLAGGSWPDYRRLERFHYRPGRPATVADIVIARFIPHPQQPPLQPPADRPRPAAAGIVAGVAVLSWPMPNVGARTRHLRLEGLSLAGKARFANANLRTISRVIVHPQFRGIGLASQLVRCLLDRCPTRYVEALAHMARAHPFFERAGMRCIDAGNDNRPAWFLHDRLAVPTPPAHHELLPTPHHAG